MRVWSVAILVGALGALSDGCGDDDQPEPSSSSGDEDAGPRSGDGAAGASGGGAGQVTDEAEIRALLTEFVEEYDRTIRAACACYVAMGAFPSEEACFALTGSGSTWVDCGTAALVKRGEPYERADAECNIARNRARADCLEAVSCDDLSPCDFVGEECPAMDVEITTLVLEECPDLGILSRLDGGT